MSHHKSNLTSKGKSICKYVNYMSLFIIYGLGEMQHIRILNILGSKCVETSAIINLHPHFQLATSRVFGIWIFSITTSTILAQLRVLDPCQT